MLLYVRNDLKCVALDNLNELNCESVWMELSENSGYKITIGVCYRSYLPADCEIADMFTGQSKG